MARKAKLKFDKIGNWSEVKLDIIKGYAAAYSAILAKRKSPSLYHVYIDAFAGAGTHISKQTGDFVPGSPLNALLVQPPFHEFHFIDIDGGKAKRLRELASGRPEVVVYEEDCNSVLLDNVFPRARYTD